MPTEKPTAAPLTAESSTLAPQEVELSGVIFDCDGTLADTMPLHYRAWQSALAGTPLELDEGLFYALGGVPSVDIVRALNERHGTALDPHSVTAAKERFYVALLPQAQPIREVVQLVWDYHGKAPLAVASGGLRSLVLRTLDALGITHLFDVIATAEDVLVGKPAPDLFLYAAGKMGSDPTRCLVYEDSPLGLEAARRAGMRGIDIRTLVSAAG